MSNWVEGGVRGLQHSGPHSGFLLTHFWSKAGSEIFGMEYSSSIKQTRDTQKNLNESQRESRREKIQSQKATRSDSIYVTSLCNKIR